MTIKRPQGLNKAAKSKKLKTDDNDNEKTTKEATPELNIALDDEVDPDDELAQLFGLFETYRNSEKDSPKLLYGIVHECDRLLRNSTDKLPSKYHDIYSKSLLDLAKFVDLNDADDDEEENGSRKTESDKGESSRDFIIAAIERATTGIEQSPESADLLFTRSHARIALADDKIKNLSPLDRYGGAADTVTILEQAIEDFEQAENLLLESGKTFVDYNKDQLSTIEDLLLIADGFAALEQDRLLEEEEENDDNDTNPSALHGKYERYLDWSKIRYQKILDSTNDNKGKSKDPKGSGLAVLRWANRGMGQYYLALVAPLLAKVEVGDDDDDADDSEDEDQENDKERKESEQDTDDESRLTDEELSHAKSLLNQAVEYLLKSESDEEPETYSIVAEALISLANLNEVESDEQKRLYAEAVLRLKKSQRLGYGNFQELIADLEE